ncbi:MAG TPA: hypothetical protein P5079_05310, partial [Elusimicrobiota bacterium]|nr:hypothetical protein [Elusimicrobiota bacterium]
DFGFLFLYNYHFTPRQVSVTLPFPGGPRNFHLPSKGRLWMEPLSAMILPLNLPLAKDVRFLHATAEPLDLRLGRKKMEVVFSSLPGRTVEGALALPKKPRAVKAGARKLPVRWNRGVLSLSFKAETPETALTVAL